MLVIHFGTPSRQNDCARRQPLSPGSPRSGTTATAHSASATVPTTNGLTVCRMRSAYRLRASRPSGPYATAAIRSRLHLPGTTRLALRASRAGSEGGRGVRYILRRCELRQRKEHYRREDKIARLSKAVKERNQFVSGSKKAIPEAGLKKLDLWAKQHKILSFVDLFLEDDQIKMIIDKDKKADDSLLDGCYVVETDVSNNKLDTETVWDRYGDLQKVERDFRRMKTTLIEIRPIFVRKESRTRGHVFVSMLSLKVARLMESRLYNAFQTTRKSDDAVTVEDAMDALLRLCLNYYHIGDQTITGLPRPDDYQQKILDALGVNIKAPIATPTLA